MFEAAQDMLFDTIYDSSNGFTQVTVSYNGETITAFFREKKTISDNDVVSGQNSSKIDYAELDVLKSDVSLPAVDDIVIVDGVVWYMKTVLKATDLDHTLIIGRNERPYPW